MNTCERLSDRMPFVALGRERWTPEEEAHLGGCPDCRAEWALLRAAGRIGGRAPRIGAGTELTAGVLRRLADAPPAKPTRRVVPWAVGLATAAGITLAIWTGLPRPDVSVVPPDSLAAVTDGMGAAEIDSLLQDDDPVAGWSMLETPGMGDLDEEELEQVLRTWEG